MNESNNNQPSKSEVQTTKLNKVPFPGEFDTEFSADEVAEVFEQNPAQNQQAKDQTPE
ncbi:hypothetical protein [Paenibacillus crassostreae]|uniref:hypothetical protein n=1 Tax=Paenibacillus crassostreae TaxID=1763538 RepID=UPI000A947677|nr:hypothetical protein [Paenibacillus crassostreae]